MEAKREEFRSYLERSGAIHSLTQALMKLYEATEKPENAVPFICSAMSGGTTHGGGGSELFRAQNRIHDLERELSAVRRGDEFPTISTARSSQRSHQSDGVAGEPRLSQRSHHSETDQREEISDEPRLSQRSHQSGVVADEARLSQRSHHSETGQREEISDEPRLSQRSHQSGAVADEARLSQRSHHSEAGQREEISDEPRLSQRSHQSGAVADEPRLSQRSLHSEANHQTSGFIEPPTDLGARSHSEYLDDNATETAAAVPTNQDGFVENNNSQRSVHNSFGGSIELPTGSEKPNPEIE